MHTCDCLCSSVYIFNQLNSVIATTTTAIAIAIVIDAGNSVMVHVSGKRKRNNLNNKKQQHTPQAAQKQWQQ